MANKYRLLKDKHQKEVNELPYMFAFNDEQFKNGLKKLGLNENETNKLIYFGAGIYLKKVDLPKVEEVHARHKKELEFEIKSDTIGDKFIKDMFLDEMYNHEYGYTRDIQPVLEALNISENNLRHSENLRNGLMLAKQLFEEKEQEQEDIEEEIEI